MSLIDRAVNRIIRPLGLQRRPMPHGQTAAILAGLGFRPGHVIDVGAHQGGWTRAARHFFPDARYTLFEPQADLHAAMADLAALPGVRLVVSGAGPRTGISRFAVHERSDSRSFAFDSGHAQAMGWKEIELPIVRLDEFVRREGLPQPELIKIDAEGWDLEVVEGASGLLGGVEVVYLEASVLHQALPNTVAESCRFMAGKGFSLFDITDPIRTTKDRLLLVVELVFIRDGGAVQRAVLERLPRNFRAPANAGS